MKLIDLDFWEINEWKKKCEGGIFFSSTENRWTKLELDPTQHMNFMILLLSQKLFLRKFEKIKRKLEIKEIKIHNKVFIR